MSVTLKVTGQRQRVDVGAIAKVIAGLAPGLILKRTAAGFDITDKRFAPYTTGYARALAEAGEDGRVDLRVTGGMLNSVKVRSIEVTADRAVVVIAPDGGTAPAVSLAEGGAKRTGKRGPPNNAKGYWLHNGTPEMRARPWLGLSPKDRAVIQRAVVAAGKSKP